MFKKKWLKKVGLLRFFGRLLPNTKTSASELSSVTRLTKT